MRKRHYYLLIIQYENLGLVRLSHQSLHNDLHLLGNQKNAGLNLWTKTVEMNTV